MKFCGNCDKDVHYKDVRIVMGKMRCSTCNYVLRNKTGDAKVSPPPPMPRPKAKEEGASRASDAHLRSLMERERSAKTRAEWVEVRELMERELKRRCMQ